MTTAPLTGEPLALDLVNTVASTPGGEVDLLEGADDLRAWLAAERDRLDITDGQIDLGAVRALRAHVTSAVEAARAGTPPPPEALGGITDAQRNAPAHQELGWNGRAIIITTRRPGNATAVLLAQLAEAAATLLASPAIGLVRSCERPGCRMLFLPAHPRRRWCSPATCGNRARVARYYQLHKENKTPSRLQPLGTASSNDVRPRQMIGSGLQTAFATAWRTLKKPEPKRNPPPSGDAAGQKKALLDTRHGLTPVRAERNISLWALASLRVLSQSSGPAARR